MLTIDDTTLFYLCSKTSKNRISELLACFPKIEIKQFENPNALLKCYADQIPLAVLIDKPIQELAKTISQLKTYHLELSIPIYLVMPKQQEVEVEDPWQFCAQHKLNGIIEYPYETVVLQVIRVSMQQFAQLNKMVLAKQQEIIRAQLRHPVSKLPNRAAYEVYLGRELELIEHYPITLGILLVDIDDFADYFKAYGQADSNRCVQQIAKAMAALAEAYQWQLFHIGGDEFLFLKTSLPKESLESYSQEIKNTMARLRILASPDIQPQWVTLSCAGLWIDASKQNALLNDVKIINHLTITMIQEDLGLLMQKVKKQKNDFAVEVICMHH